MYLRMFIILLVSLYTTRVVFNTLGVENYGIYNIVGGVIVFFTFINSSLAGATQRYITAELAQGTVESQREVFSAAILAHFFIGLGIVLLGETLGLWFLNSVMNIPEERMFAARIVYQLSIFSTFISVLQSPFNAAIMAYEKMSIYAIFSIIDVLIKLSIAFLIQAIAGDKLIIYAILITIAGLIIVLLYRFYCYRNFQMCQFKRTFDRGLFKGLFSYMGWALFGTATYVGTNQGVAMLINYYNGVIINAAMGVSNQIVSVVSQFVSNFQVAFRPQITKNYVTKDKDKLIKLTVLSSRISAYLILILLVPICFEIKDFLHLWLGDYPLYAVEFSVLTLVCIYFESICNPIIVLITSDKNIKSYQLTVSIIYSSTLLFSWVALSRGLFPYMVIVIRLVIDLILIISRLALMSNRWYDFPISSWLKRVIFKPLVVMVIPVSISFLLKSIPIESIWARIIVFSGLSFIACFVCIYFFLIEKEERAIIATYLANIKGKLFGNL